MPNETCTYCGGNPHWLWCPYGDTAERDQLLQQIEDYANSEDPTRFFFRKVAADMRKLHEELAKTQAKFELAAAEAAHLLAIVQEHEPKR